MNKNEIHKMIDMISDDSIEKSEIKAVNTSDRKSFLLTRWKKVAILAVCFIIVTISATLIFRNYFSVNKEASSIVTFNNLWYNFVIPQYESQQQAAILHKYGLAETGIVNTITEDMLGEFVGYVGGTLGSKKPLFSDVSELYYISNMKTLDIMIMKDYNSDYLYVISENVEGSYYYHIHN